MSRCRVLKSRVEKGWRGLEILAPQSDTHKIRDHSMLKQNPAGGRHSPPELDGEGTVHRRREFRSAWGAHREAFGGAPPGQLGVLGHDKGKIRKFNLGSDP